MLTEAQCSVVSLQGNKLNRSLAALSFNLKMYSSYSRSYIIIVPASESRSFIPGWQQYGP